MKEEKKKKRTAGFGPGLSGADDMNPRNMIGSNNPKTMSNSSSTQMMARKKKAKRKDDMGESIKKENKEQKKEAADTERPRKKAKRSESKAKGDEANGVGKPEQKEGKEQGAVTRKAKKRTTNGLGQKPLPKHAPAQNSPTAYRTLAKRINAKGNVKVNPVGKGIKAGLAEYERMKRHGR